jgi:hypothetical protein
MKSVIARSALLAIVIFAALFALKLKLGDDRTVSGSLSAGVHGITSEFDMSRKNYASAKKDSGGAAAQPLGDVQKYEKIATLSEQTREYDASRQKTDALIAASDALIQYERFTGLTGRRVLHLGVGVPPAKFDSFIEGARKIAQLTSLSIMKNDKTNEYRELRAKRETLEKTRKALTELGGSGGSVDERLRVQAQLTAVEEKIQALGVSLGDFDSQNEFCTVKLTFEEVAAPVAASRIVRLFRTFVWTLEYFTWLAIGLLVICLTVWVGALAVRTGMRESHTLTRE